MTRLSSSFRPLAIVIALAATAHAQSTQAELAAKLNDEGKELMYADKFPEAVKKFQEAVARVPEAKYFVNLCTARLQLGQLDEALTACNAVELNGASPEQKERATTLVKLIRDQAKEQHLELHTTGGCSGPDCTTKVRVDDAGGTTNPPGTTTGYTPTVGRPITQNLVLAAPPDHRYTWTLGVDFFGGGGRIGQESFYGSAVLGVRFKSDYLLDAASRTGGEGYLQLSHLGRGQNDMANVDTLDIFDIGVAIFKNICPGGTPRLCFTPLAGAHVSLMSPGVDSMNSDTGSQVFNYAALGGRLELSMELAFGRRYEHVIAAAVGANLYSAVLSSSGEFSAQDLGLDRAGAAGYISLGYTYRFNTPLGRAPIVILE